MQRRIHARRGFCTQNISDSIYYTQKYDLHPRLKRKIAANITRHLFDEFGLETLKFGLDVLHQKSAQYRFKE